MPPTVDYNRRHAIDSFQKTSAPTIIVDTVQTDEEALFQRNGSVRARALELEKSGFVLRSCAGSAGDLIPPGDR